MEKVLSLYFRKELISLEVVVPIEHVGEFVVRFGERFSIDDTGRGKVARKVTDYHSHQNGWHVIVIVEKEFEKELDEFLCEFAQEHDLSFRSRDDEE